MAPNAMIYSVDLWSEEFILQDLKDTYGDAKNYEFKEHPLWETYLMNVWSLQDRNVPVRMKTVEGLHALKDAGIEPDVIYVRLHTHTRTPLAGTNVSTCFISCPSNKKKTLGIKLPFLVMIIKNLKKYFTFEVQVLDDKNVRRRFRASNYQSTTRVKPFICTMPMRLDEGWNQIQFNLSDFTRRAYGTNYIETLRVQIHANCRIRRIYFSDRLYSEDELPPEFKLFLPIERKASEAAAAAAAADAEAAAIVPAEQ